MSNTRSMFKYVCDLLQVLLGSPQCNNKLSLSTHISMDRYGTQFYKSKLQFEMQIICNSTKKQNYNIKKTNKCK